MPESAEKSESLSPCFSLFDSAEFSSISATAFVNNVCTSMAVSKQDRKLHIPIFLNSYRISGLIDSGSDVSILNKSLFDKIKGQHDHILTNQKLTIQTFSNNNIEVLGKVEFLVQLSKTHPGIVLHFWITEDIPNAPNCLLGQDLLLAGLGSINMTGNPENPQHQVSFKHPCYFETKSYFCSPNQIKECYAYAELKPKETQDLEFTLNKGFAGIRTDHVLISSVNFAEVMVLPSCSDITFEEI